MENEMHHIERGHKGTWCGETAGWNFLSLDHAAENGAEKNGFSPCPDCIQHALKAMNYWRDNIKE